MANTGFISVAPAIAAVAAQITAHKVATDATGVEVTTMEGTDLPAVASDVSAIGVLVTTIEGTDLPAVKVDTADIRSNMTAVHDVDLPAVKTDTTALKARIDKQNVAKTARAERDTNTYIDILNENNKGVLTGISMECKAFTANGYANILIDVDGTALCGSGYNLWFEKTGDSYSMAFNHEFETSLRVQICIDAANHGTVEGICSYTID